MMAHTPGPWFAGPLTNDGWDEDIQMVSIGPYSLADRPNKDHHYEDSIADVHHANGNDAEANARLIAASPDLLEALQDAIGALEYDLDAGKDSGDSDWEGIAYQRLEAARAAIAKATGGQA